MTTSFTPRPTLPPPSPADTGRRRPGRPRIGYLIAVGLCLGAIIAFFSSSETRDAIVISRKAEENAALGMLVIRQGAMASDDYIQTARSEFDAAVARARPGQRMEERIGRWLADQGEYRLATHYLLDALRLRPGHGLAILTGSTAAASRDTEAATEAYAQAMLLEPDDPQAYNDLAYYYAVEGIHLDQAEELAMMALARTEADSPFAAAYWDTLAWIYYKQGRYVQAWEAMQNVDPAYDADPVVREHRDAIRLALESERQGRRPPFPREDRAMPDGRPDPEPPAGEGPPS
ncbi:MAG: hypothetical protein GF320_00625 [Armatimonadia bacterium]|nr:hypothetical protein [Armatimonadia bacterium]